MAQYCVRCGERLEDGIRFCTACGAPVGDAAQDETTVLPTDTIRPPRPVRPSYEPRPAVSAGSSWGGIAAKVVIGALAGVGVAALIGVFLLHGIPAPDTGANVEEARTAPTPQQEESVKEPEETPAPTVTAPAPTPEPTPAPAPEPEPAPTPEVPSTGSYVLPDSTTRDYTYAELDALSNWELYLARNELYARHGRQFVNQDLQTYFGSQPWYQGTIPPDSFDEGVFNSHEIHNRDLIKEIEVSRNSPYL